MTVACFFVHNKPTEHNQQSQSENAAVATQIREKCFETIFHAASVDGTKWIGCNGRVGNRRTRYILLKITSYLCLVLDRNLNIQLQFPEINFVKLTGTAWDDSVDVSVDNSVKVAQMCKVVQRCYNEHGTKFSLVGRTIQLQIQSLFQSFCFFFFH